MRKRTHVREYYRSKHGLSEHGGEVSEHNRGYEAASGLKSMSDSTKKPHATISTDVYLFDDLDDKAKEKALEWAREINVDYDWWDGEVDYYKNEWKEKLGITFDKAYFDLDRDDYLYLEDAHVTDAEKFVKSARAAGYDIPDLGDTYEIYIRTNYGAMSTGRNYVEVEYFVQEKGTGLVLDDVPAGAEEGLTRFLNGKLNEMKTSLRSEFEGLMSDEAVIDTIQANEYTFTKDGKRFG